ncbi:MAG: DUF308 domain-containing protein [Eubacterium sp.]|nr:DUF308 domain-containing protein [Eubacterium sp.]
MTNAQWFIETFPALTVLYGAFFLVIGLIQIQWIVDMIRMKRANWLFQMLSSFIMIAIAVIILINPFRTAEYLWIFAGAALVLCAVPDLIIALRKRSY